MTKVVTLERAAAPISIGSPNAVPSSSALDSTDPILVALHAQAENALVVALRLLRNPAGTSVDRQRATFKAIRASSLLKQACSIAQAAGGAS